MMTAISDSAEVTDRVRIEARLTSLETVIETERPHLATKADLERQTREMVKWLVATAIAILAVLAAMLVPAGLALFELLGQILERLPAAP